jgi:hypothetical protein
MATMNPEDGADAAADAGTAAAADAPDATYAPDDACADQRRIADERCAVATRAREGAAAAQETLRTRQRAYDDMLSSAEAAAAAADPRAVRAAKEAAQLAFREARAVGRTRDDVEAAARDWLTEINRINVTTRDAAATAERHQRAAADLARDLERLSVEADAARISAESAEEACVAAREAVAACQEAVALAAAGASATPETPSVEDLVDAEADLATPMGSRAGEDASIIRMLRGDRDVTNRVVATLAGDDEAERRRWQGLLGGLLEALIARAIEASAFDFPLEGSFWSLFTRSQARDIAGALASLGYRHDGFGGWADDRVPSQRDLSLAVGYAGLDPMRIRRWPSETEMPDLLRDVTVAADEYVWEAAGGLTLGELVTLLGRRADPLAELWNEWGNVRPLLLSADCRGRSGLAGVALRGLAGRAFLLVLLDNDDPERLARLDADRLALLLRPPPHPLVELLRLMDLARVGPQRVDLATDRRAHVDAGVGIVGPEQVEPPDDVLLEAAAGEPRERHRVTSGRIDGVDRGHAGRPVIGVVHAAVAVEDDLRIGREHGVRPERPDLADEELAKGEVVG